MYKQSIRRIVTILTWLMLPCLMLPISACQPVPPPMKEQKMNRNLPNSQSLISMLALGDSYTIGESVATSERWPEQLATQLRAEGISMAEPVIVARTGWTTDELAEGIKRAEIKGQFDLVTLLIGVNNQYRRRELKEYREEFRGLLAQALTFAGGDPQRVIVLSIPDWGVMPFAQGRDQAEIALQIGQFNAVNQEEAKAAEVNYVDITPISRWAATDSSFVAGDGLHPSGEMYTKWVEAVLPVAKRVVDGRL